MFYEVKACCGHVGRGRYIVKVSIYVPKAGKKRLLSFEGSPE